MKDSFLSTMQKGAVVFIVLGVLFIFIGHLFFVNELAALFTSIGSATIIAGIVWSVYNLTSSKQLSKLLNELQKSMHDRMEVLTSTYSSGIERVYENQSKVLTEYASIIRQTKLHVDILGITLINLWWNPEFEVSTIDAMKRGVKFRVALLDPRSAAIRLLSRQERRSDESISAELKLSLQRWQELQMKSPFSDAIQIRVYSEVPNLFLMITDDRLFLAPYLHSISTFSAPCFEVRAKDGFIYQTYKSHFEALWMQEMPVEYKE